MTDIDNSGTAGVLEHDHQVIDAHFAQFGSALDEGRIELQTLEAGAQGLRHHSWVEEELHFPALRQAGLVGPVMVMLREHGQLWDSLDSLIALAASVDADPAVLQSEFTRLSMVLEQHNAKDEQILHPMGDQLITDEVSAPIREALESGSHTKAGPVTGPVDADPE